MEQSRRYIGTEAKKAALAQLGLRLKEARVQAGKVQRQAAELLGTTTQTVRNWEAGRREPPESAIRRLADFYSVPRRWLFQGNDIAVLPPTPGIPYNRIVVDRSKMLQARQATGLTQSNVAVLTGISASAIGRYERGEANPEPDTLEALAAIYERPAQWFTLRGYFTQEELRHLEEEAAMSSYLGYYGPSVMDAYYEARPMLLPEDEATIVNFIRFIYERRLARKTRGQPSR